MIDPNPTNATSISEQFLKEGMTPPVKTEVPKNEENGKAPENNEGTIIDWEAKAKELESKTLTLESELQAARNVEPKIIERVLTQEEVLSKKKAEENEILNYVVQDKKLSALDYEKFLNSNNIADRDYVFEKYKAQRKDDGVSEAELLEDFEEEYKLNSQDEKVLARATNKLEREAKEYRSEDFKDFKNIHEEFNTVKTIKAKAEGYKGLISSAKPEVKITYTPEGFTEPIELVIDYTDILPELQKELATAPYFQEFTNEAVDTKKAVDDFIIRTVKEKKSEAIVTQLAQKTIDVLKTNIEKGSIHPIPAQTGSKVENKTTTHPTISKLMEAEGITPQPPKTT